MDRSPAVNNDGNAAVKFFGSSECTVSFSGPSAVARNGQYRTHQQIRTHPQPASGDNRMRTLLISAVMPLVLAIPASAQDLPSNQNAAPAAAQDQNALQSAQTIQEMLRSDLERAGFTDIQLAPSSFLVRAKDPDGNLVTMMLAPDSTAEVEVAPDQGGAKEQDTGNSVPSGRSSTGGQGATDAK
jgi:hypothetical protein